MLEHLDGLLHQYERGQVTRRELLGAIALLSAPPQTSAEDSVLKARRLNHVNIRVTDVARAEAFYRRVLGFPANRPVDGAAFALDLPGGGFVSLCPVATGTCGVKAVGTPGEIDHFAIGIDGYETPLVMEKLRREGIKASDSGTSVWITDPDGTAIQLSAVNQAFPPRK